MSQSEPSRRGSRSIWVVAALLAVGIHAVGVSLAIGTVRPEPAEELGAPAIEIGLELEAPHREPTDLPPGPETEASAPSPAVLEQQSNIEPTDLPKDVSTETEDPDRIVSPDDSRKPEEEDPKVTTVEALPSTESVAAEAMAAPSSEIIKESNRSAAPAQGIGESARRVRTTWERELAAHLDRHKRYPTNRARQSAQVVVSFVLDRAGHVLSASVARGSGDPSFDAAALAMMKRSDPVPAPPPLVADEGLSFTLPVIFRVRGRS